MRSLLWSFLLVFPLIVLSPSPPAALASETWCDTDPILLIQTPAGRLVPVFVTVGAQSVVFTPNTLLGSLLVSYTAAPARGGTATKLTVVVNVPPSQLQPSFATRATISAGALGSGTVYARGTGVSGSSMISTFELASP